MIAAKCSLICTVVINYIVFSVEAQQQLFIERAANRPDYDGLLGRLQPAPGQIYIPGSASGDARPQIVRVAGGESRPIYVPGSGESRPNIIRVSKDDLADENFAPRYKLIDPAQLSGGGSQPVYVRSSGEGGGRAQIVRVPLEQQFENEESAPRIRVLSPSQVSGGSGGRLQPSGGSVSSPFGGFGQLFGAGFPQFGGTGYGAPAGGGGGGGGGYAAGGYASGFGGGSKSGGGGSGGFDQFNDDAFNF